MDLIIVESPTKANTFNKYLKSNEYQVEATIGHVRDLPQKKIGIDLEHGFKPDYVLNEEKKETIEKIKKQAQKASSIILATDADREGEAIAYHIAQILGYIKEDWPQSTLKKQNKLKRIVFHEITKDALEEALKLPRELNFNLIDAQQTRRILDRIVGYKLSPLLWKKIGKRWLSAGRVQTVALRFIVEREKEIEKFASEVFFRGTGRFKSDDTGDDVLEAQLHAKDDQKYEQKFTVNLFDGDYTYTKTSILKKDVESLTKDIESDTFSIESIQEKVSSRSPAPPYITSTLQQDAARKLGYSSKQTMRLAQNLYEKGMITYHRTDSVTISPKFIQQASEFIREKYGNQYVLESPRLYKTSTKSAQEAHEAIRPTDVTRQISGEKGITSRHERLYSIILNRALATQMKDAQIKTLSISIKGKKGYIFKTKQEQVMFDGYLKLYPKIEYGTITFSKKEGDEISLNNIDFVESATQPPPRYSEASLIKTLEKRGIGRPSTYAPIISTIETRNYVEKMEGRFFPTILGKAVSDYLSKAFVDLFTVDFTAEMEDKLDKIAENKHDMIKTLTEFYKPLEKNIVKEQNSKGHIDVQEETNEKCPESEHPLVIRFSKFGKFLACSDYPNCKYTKNFMQKVDQKCPKCKGGDIIVRFTKRKKRFYGCSNYPKCDFAAWKLNEIESSSPSSE
ncbi:DNA topoisomerase I [Candidatus Roizmanbacteria bacterium RIFCSPLOWO2_02_FULL_37_19]|uniref:DNA topoisomerase 1 n=1 Tax=Candidatus Roizmanbacteria bacterium RIFCSPHIGHO2_02_FULL_37_24 TaxID=1802037 RepID=A0A1F7GYZ7_9BACT|nr:MAG: DNA topoisomerase I [Candidatus Roizmanbacteria bacterium RIFCSPHIGHO2_01_FULL_38_41]OGK23742.1 MAG: DNA topoisomerase I [Candidatus Roizmanbacteria bacterium RIFCSPHIGHO2_02_FULL_37_24]OGK32685.1 MAG: DNA topoisomerase I [Candidatus Roizmanbacteria bacterium RIFCSPHIGHO2_12_FULL_37_23]OGK44749.1 MAG: DNA topoisomerase I [Candidatus Roizmanbacteria bacterium RIFCSPLOWO2_01_FULL_37_57]OGK53999.1 MAG: DNA topoisomerase I [Candidatus Roizmanbacteria bacterium RIFCSPLOWO2_02_FULL_37_19]